MTLDEAIAKELDIGIQMMCSSETRSCGQEHMQLAKWLEELKMYKKMCTLSKEDVV